MMLIISISVIGIYSMVNNGQKLATLTDNRLTAINIAKEGIESIGALRDTFVLRSYGASGCFFTIDAGNYTDCPLVDSTRYILSDAKTLIPASTTDTTVCINEHGWYSQEKIDSTHPCNKDVADICGTKTRSCRTQFSRKISFVPCESITDTASCIKAKTEVIW